MAVLERGTIKALDIAERVHFSPSTLVGVLDRLEAKSLIRRERNAEDRREVSIIATEAGKRLVSRTPFPLQRSLGHALSQLSEREREELAGWMERMVDLLGAGGLSARSMLEIGPLRKRQG
jgi:DNA-binding MarR family transcriptional regulator